MEYLSSLCSGCGLPRSETTNAANEDRYTAMQIRCFACAARAREERSIAEGQQRNPDDKGATDGILIAVLEGDPDDDDDD